MILTDITLLQVLLGQPELKHSFSETGTRITRCLLLSERRLDPEEWCQPLSQRLSPGTILATRTPSIPTTKGTGSLLTPKRRVAVLMRALNSSGPADTSWRTRPQIP